jgi:hypothetical protein
VVNGTDMTNKRSWIFSIVANMWELSVVRIETEQIVSYYMYHPNAIYKIIHSQARIWILILVFNTTFSNISGISWRPVLVVEEAGVPGENHRPWTSNW